MLTRSHWDFLPPASQRGKKVTLTQEEALFLKVTFPIYLIPRINVWEFNLRNSA
jgi:hypothetical protein